MKEGNHIDKSIMFSDIGSSRNGSEFHFSNQNRNSMVNLSKKDS